MGMAPRGVGSSGGEVVAALPVGRRLQAVSALQTEHPPPSMPTGPASWEKQPPAAGPVGRPSSRRLPSSPCQFMAIKSPSKSLPSSSTDQKPWEACCGVQQGERVLSAPGVHLPVQSIQQSDPERRRLPAGPESRRVRHHAVCSHAAQQTERVFPCSQGAIVHLTDKNMMK